MNEGPRFQSDCETAALDDGTHGPVESAVSSGESAAHLTLHTGTPLPPQLVTNVSNWNPTDLTVGWLETLPRIVAETCEKWQITLDPIIPESFITLVLLGHSEEFGPVAIKSSPLADEFRAEATALSLAAGPTVSRLYDVNLERSIMVSERVIPGIQLRHVPMGDEQSTRLAAELALTFWRPVTEPAGLFPLRRWMRALFNWSTTSNLIDPELIRHAQEIANHLLANSSRDLLLHGDFQHHNILQRASGEWAIIDPKGVFGPPGFEFAAWMYNPPGVTAREDYRTLAIARASICSEIWGIERDELIAWAFLGSALSCCWSAEDATPDGWLDHSLRGARHLRALVS